MQPHRARLVEQALRALPADAVEDVRTGDGRTVGTDEPGAYDRVLVDAPCTGLGRAAAASGGALAPDAGRPRGLSALQRDLLVSALRAVRPGESWRT